MLNILSNIRWFILFLNYEFSERHIGRCFFDYFVTSASSLKMIELAWKHDRNYLISQTEKTQEMASE